MGPDPRTPEQKDAEGKAALDQLLGRPGLFGWGPVMRRAASALAEAVAERTATGRISPATANRAAIAVQAALVAPEPAPPPVVEPEPAPDPTPTPTPTEG